MFKQRFAILLLIVFAFSSLSSSASTEWPTFHQNLERTGYQPDTSEASFEHFDLLWSYETGGKVKSSPALADLNGDNQLEIIIGSDDGHIYVFNNTGNLFFKYKTGGTVRSPPSIADVDLDGNQDIVFGSNDKNLYVISAEGKLIFNYTTDAGIIISPAVTQLVDTAHPEIVFGSKGEQLIVLNHKGEAQFTYRIPNGITTSPSISDVNSDGKKEIITSSNNNIIYIFKYPPYLHWEYFTQDANVLATPVLADYDLDRVKEILLFANNGRINAIKQVTYSGDQPRPRKCDASRDASSCFREQYQYTKYTSELNLYVPKNHSFLEKTHEDIIRATPVVVNTNNGRRLDFIIPTIYENHLYLIDTSDPRSDKIVGIYTANAGIESSPAAADLNNDGLLDIIFGSNDGKIHIIDINSIIVNGSADKVYNQSVMRARWVYLTGGPIRSSPAVADINNDNTLEVVIGSDDGRVYVFGDRFRWLKNDADVHYESANQTYTKNNISAALKELNKSREIYLDIGDEEGLDKINFLLKRITGDSLLNQARDHYQNKSYLNATQRIQQAELVYKYISDEEGLLKVENFLTQIKIDSIISEVDYYMSLEDYDNATLLAKQAINESNQIGYIKGIYEAQNTLKKIEKIMEASQYYIDALKLIQNDTNNTRVYVLLEKARVLYIELNQTKEVDRVDFLIDKLNAKRYYQKAVEEYNKENYVNASNSAVRSVNLYTMVNDTEGIKKAQELSDKSALYVSASNLLENARTYYAATDFIASANYAQEAKDMYEELGDEFKTMEAQVIIDHSVDAYKHKDQQKTPLVFKLILAFVAFIAIIRIRVVWHEQGRPGPKKLMRSILQTPTKLEKTVAKRRETKRSSINEIQAKEITKKEKPSEKKKASSLSKILHGLRKKAEKEESLAEKIEEEIKD